MNSPKKKKSRKAVKPAPESEVNKDEDPFGSLCVSENHQKKLPDLKELIAIAATIAQPKEDENITARRAIKLWQACSSVLGEVSMYIDMDEEDEQERHQILSACGLDSSQGFGTNSIPKMIPLETFLKAIKPTGETESIREIWVEFWEIETKSRMAYLADGNPPNTSMQYKFPSTQNGDLFAASLVNYHQRFSRFLEIATRRRMSAKGRSGPQARKLYAAAKAVLDDKSKATAEQMEMLVELDKADLERVIEKCCKDIPSGRKLRAAIDDVKLLTLRHPPAGAK